MIPADILVEYRIAQGLIILSALLTWTFVIGYSRTGWRQSKVGWHLMSSSVVLALTFTLTGLFTFSRFNIGPKTALGIQIAMFALFAIVEGLRVALLIYYWRQDNRQSKRYAKQHERELRDDRRAGLQKDDA